MARSVGGCAGMKDVVMWRDAGGHVLMLRDYEHRLVLIIELTGVV